MMLLQLMMLLSFRVSRLRLGRCWSCR